MKGLWRSLLAVVAACAAFPAVAAATPVNNTPPSVVGTPQVGSDVGCSKGSWGSSLGGRIVTTEYQWFHATDLVNPIFVGNGRMSRYRPTTTDLGMQLVCRVTVQDRRDFQTASASSAASAPVAPLASVTITQYSPVVVGNIGEPVAGVTVSLSLQRSSTTIAGATSTTDATGAWHATLRPINPAIGPSHGFFPGDLLTVSYAPPAGSPSTAVPQPFTYGGSFLGAQISADGTAVATTEFADCRFVSFVIDGTRDQASGSNEDICRFSPASPLTDADHVQTLYRVALGSPGDKAVEHARAEAGLLGGGSGPPTCDADLVARTVTCGPLNAGQFAVALDGGSPVALTTSAPDSPPITGTATLPGLKPGDTITLDETSPTATSRHLTTLPVLRLRVALDAGTFVSGRCQRGEPFSNGLCPSDGVTPASGIANPQRLFDDRSSGTTTVTVPSLNNFIPSQDASLFGGTFTAYANLTGQGTPSQLLAETGTVHLKIRRDGSSAPVFSQDMTPHTSSDGAYESADVTGLAVGRYFADWLLTDVNGDTNAFETLFAVQPAAAGTPGAAQPK